MAPSAPAAAQPAAAPAGAPAPPKAEPSLALATPTVTGTAWDEPRVSLKLKNLPGPLTLTPGAFADKLPAAAVRLDPGQRTLVITLKGAAAGEYSDELVFSDGARTYSAALTVRVRHPFPLPLALLITGLGLGLWINLRAQGRRRAALLQREARLYQAREGMAPAFADRLEGHLRVVHARREGRQWDEAEAEVKAAEALRERWERSPAQWRQTLRELVALREGLGDDGTRLCRELKAACAALESEAPDLPEHKALFKRLWELYEQQALYQRLRTAVTGLLEEAPAGPRRQAALELQRRFQALRLHENPEALALLADIDKARSTAEEIAPEPVRAAALAKSPVIQAGGGPGDAPRELVEQEVRRGQSDDARFTWVFGLVVVGVLAALGFKELYLAKATFGADPVTDYLALLAWGLGTDATRATFGPLFKDLGNRG